MVNRKQRITYYSGLDLGQPHEFTALAVIEKATEIDAHQPTQVSASYAVRHLERFPIGTPYPQIFSSLGKRFADPPLARSLLLVDRTGVGKAIIDLLYAAKLPARLYPITITSGLVSSCDPHAGQLVPKKDLVATMQMLLQTRRIQVAESLAEADMLVRELQNFQTKATMPASADPVAAWREGKHDDLVFAVAIAAWQAERMIENWREQMAWVFDGTGVRY